MPNYELTLIVRPLEGEEQIQATVSQITNTIANLGGQVTKTDQWSRRRLAYPIRKYREGHYVLMDISLGPTALPELERSLKFNEDVIRYFIVRAGQ